MILLIRSSLKIATFFKKKLKKGKERKKEGLLPARIITLSFKLDAFNKFNENKLIA